MFVLTIETDNAAFHPIDASFPLAEAEQLAELLVEVADRLNDGESAGRLQDINGNTVGQFELASAPAEVRRALAAVEAAAYLDKREWDAATLEVVAHILRGAGLVIGPPR